MEEKLVENQPSRTTSERILDAAEDLFAAAGYSATSLADVADVVGIRTPSLYNHFRNKEALYGAVLDRLIVSFSSPLEELEQNQLTYEQVFEWLEKTVRQHHANPNLARLLQHAALSGGPHTDELIDRLFRPMFNSSQAIEGGGTPLLGDTDLQPWAVMAFNNLVMSYVTMAPMYSDVLGQDPFGEPALERQLKLIKMLLRAVFEYKGG
ncbi:MAG: TetR/AcrR family transcriptional regulator [Proteobacteria bacterium]|nr:TetR/AcrR family transcriptional regulator [Pseudomonadota bacterium]